MNNNQYQLAQNIIILQDAIMENKIKMENQISKLKRDLYAVFGVVFLFLFSSLAYQLYIIFK